MLLLLLLPLFRLLRVVLLLLLPLKRVVLPLRAFHLQAPPPAVCMCPW